MNETGILVTSIVRLSLSRIDIYFLSFNNPNEYPSSSLSTIGRDVNASQASASLDPSGFIPS